MSIHLTEEWLQNVIENLQMPAASPSVTRTILSNVEMNVRKILQQAQKFQRRGKKQLLTADEFNMVLHMNKIEPVYGTYKPPETLTSKKKISFVELLKQPLPNLPLQPELSLHWLAVEGVQPMIPENPTPQSLTALQIAGGSIPMTTTTSSSSSSSAVTDSKLISTGTGSAGTTEMIEEEDLTSLPREMQLVYLRVIRALEGGPGAEIAISYAVCDALLTDPSMQTLLPHISLFIYTKVRDANRTIDLLKRLMRAVWCLVLNPHISIEFHLQQLLPAIFTCVVAHQLVPITATISSSSNGSSSVVTEEKTAKRLKSTILSTDKSGNSSQVTAAIAAAGGGMSDVEEQWHLRVLAAEIISCCCIKYSALFPDLQARVLKTYLEGLGVFQQATSSTHMKKSLYTMYGAIAGISAMGSTVVGTILLPHLKEVALRLQAVHVSHTQQNNITSSSSLQVTAPLIDTATQQAYEKLKLLLLQTLGHYYVQIFEEINDKYAGQATSFSSSIVSGKKMRNRFKTKIKMMKDDQNDATDSGSHKIKSLPSMTEDNTKATKGVQIYNVIHMTLDESAVIYTATATPPGLQYCKALFI